VPDLEEVLRLSAQNGWLELVAALRKILAGRRDVSVLAGLDDEDRVIVESILRGLQDPRTLPDPGAGPDPTLAAPGIAAMLHAAAGADLQALRLLGHFAEQMSRAGGEMARLAGALRPLLNGERDPERLCRGMSTQGRGLVLSILEELARLRPQ
jgi:hypothetical protein